MEVKINIEPWQIDEIFVHQLQEQIALLMVCVDRDRGTNKEDKKTLKAAKRMLEYNTTESEYKKIMKQIKKEHKDA